MNQQTHSTPSIKVGSPVKRRRIWLLFIAGTVLLVLAFHFASTGSAARLAGGSMGTGCPNEKTSLVASQFSSNASVSIAGTCLTDTTQGDFQAGTPTNLDLTTSPGDATLSGAVNIDQQNTSLSAGGTGFTTASWAGQTFTAGVSGKLLKADIEMFCSSCSGTPPPITVSLRATAAGAPTGSDLATATIPGFLSGTSTYYTANFTSPATLTAGTVYALAIRPSSATAPGSSITYINHVSSLATAYAGGTHTFGTNSGTIWVPSTNDLGFKTYMQSGFVASGDLISSTKDANPAAGNTTNWSSIAWTATVPANTDIKFRVAASNNSAGPFNFVGPDGTAATFFSNGASLSQFNGNRYLKYRAFLSTTDTTATPTLSDVTVCYNNVPSTPTFNVNWTHVVNAVPTGNSLMKPAGGVNNWGDSGAISVEQLFSGDGYVELTASETDTHRVIGLSNGDSSQSYTDIQFGLYLNAAGSQLCVQEGFASRGCFGTYITNDILRVAVVGGQVKYSKNGTVFFTSPLTPIYPLVVDTSLYTPGATLNNVVIAGDTVGPTPSPTPVPSPTVDPNAQDVVWKNVVGVTPNANSLTKTAGEPDGWSNAGASSVQSFASGDGYVRVTASEFTTDRIFGLSHSDSNQSYTDIDYGFYMKPGEVVGRVCVNEAGVDRGCFGTFSPGDILKVAVVGGAVQYSVNGSVFFTSPTAPVYPLEVDTSLYTAGSTINNAVISGNLGPAVSPTPVASPTLDANALNVVWTAIVNANAVGNSLTKNPAGVNSWSDSGAISSQTINSGDGYLQVTASETTTHRVFGLSNGDSNQSYTDIDFGIYEAAGTLCVVEGGVSKGCFGGYAPGDILRVVVTGGQVKYWKNGIVFYTSTLSPSYPLVVDTSLFSPGATINNAIISTSSGGANAPNDVH